MGIKKRSKVSALFNMSSLTDIIFLLLIFFMLTSSLVTPNALNLQLPGKKSTSPPSETNTKVDAIRIEKGGTYYWNGSKLTISGIEKKIKDLKARKGKKAMVTISPHAKSKNDKVVPVLDAAYRYGIGVTLTEPRS